MYIYRRKVQYHETDKMGITHHSNYVKWMEEARVAFLDSIGLPFELVEEMGITSPVVGIAVDYKKPCTFADVIEIEAFIKSYDGVKLEIGYVFRNSADGALISEASSRHCFIKDGRIYSPKRDKSPMHNVLKAELDGNAIRK